MPLPGAPPPPPHGWIVLVLADLTVQEGCDCCAALWDRYTPAFANGQGIACPPFKDVRRFGAVLVAAVAAASKAVQP
jgi:hypothetical protein